MPFSRPARATLSAAIAVAIALVAALPAAALAGAQPGASPSGENPKPSEFVVAFDAFGFELDPHQSIYSAEAQVFTALYEGLFTYDPNSLDPVKAACRSFNRSQDGRTYTFYIRDDAKWSDGSPLLARDFRDAWLRALEPGRKAEYAAFFDVITGARDFRTGKSRDVASVGLSVISDKILQVKLEARADYFTRLLCHHSFSPIHRSMLANEDWRKVAHQGSTAVAGRHGSGLPVNGPYRVAEIRDDEMLLTLNESYWDAATVQIPRIRVLFTDDDGDVTRRFDDGSIHWLAGPMDLDALLDRGSIQVNPMFGTNYWFFDCGSAWRDPEIRRALALLLPWDAIRSKDEYLIPAQTLVLPYAGYQEVKGIKAADEAEARKILAAKGHADGAGLPPLVILVPEGEDAKRVSGLMEGAWKSLSELKVERRIVPASDYFEQVRKGPKASGYGLALTTWIGDFADPLAFLQMWTSDSNLNDAGLADVEYDSMIAASAQKEGEQRLSSLAAAETRLLEGAALLPIYHSLAANVVDTDYIEGWYSNALDIHPFKYFAFGERRIRPNVAYATGGRAAGL